MTRLLSTTVVKCHNPSLKKKAGQTSKNKKGKKPKKSNYGEAAYFKPSYHQIPYDSTLLEEMSENDKIEMPEELSKIKKIEEKEMNDYIKKRIEARDNAMRILRSKYPHAYIRLLESIPKSRQDRKLKELDIIPGGENLKIKLKI